MEYMPLGNLERQHQIKRISEAEMITLLCQILDALAYLHSYSPRITHRDLKPSNILVQSRGPSQEPAQFSVKLGDFGLAQDLSCLKTWCGTRRYLAPEVFHGSYDTAVDVWALAIIVSEYVYGFPPGIPSRMKDWYADIIEAAKDWDSDPLINLLSSSMLKINPQERLSASECLKKASKLHLAMLHVQNFETDLPTPTEKMSSSVIMEAVRNAECSEGRKNTEKAEAQVNCAASNKSLRHKATRSTPRTSALKSLGEAEIESNNDRPQYSIEDVQAPDDPFVVTSIKRRRLSDSSPPNTSFRNNQASPQGAKESGIVGLQDRKATHDRSQVSFNNLQTVCLVIILLFTSC